MALEFEQGVFDPQHEFFALVLFAFADASNLTGKDHQFRRQVFDAALQILDISPIFFVLASDEKESVKVFKELLQHGQ